MPILDPDHDDLCRKATWSKERTERFNPTDDPVGYARDWLDGYAHRLHEADRHRHLEGATQESYRDMLAWADDPKRDRMLEALPILLDRIRSHPHPPYSPEVLLAEWQRLQDIPMRARLRDGFVDRMSAWLDRVGTYLAIGPVSGASDGLIDRVALSLTPPKLSDDESAQVRAYLKAAMRLSALQADPAERDRRRKLQEVVAYNDDLRAAPATDESGTASAHAASPHVGDELLPYLTDRPDEMAAVIELPERFHDADLLTVSDADGLIEFGTRKHCWVGPVGESELRIEKGWNFSSITGPNRKPMDEFLAEVLTSTDDQRIRLHLRLTAKGRIRVARLKTDRVATVVEPKTNTSETDWRDIRQRLERLREQGEEYTTQARLAAKLTCSPSTINKAISRSTKLRAWKAEAIARRGNKAPPTSSLTEVHLDNTAQACEENPADVLSGEDIDRAMRRLIEEAEPEEKARLNELSEDERRTLVRVFYEQNLDQEPSPLAPDRPDHPRTVRQSKHL